MFVLIKLIVLLFVEDFSQSHFLFDIPTTQLLSTHLLQVGQRVSGLAAAFSEFSVPSMICSTYWSVHTGSHSHVHANNNHE